MTIWTRAFWRATTERALKTIAQTAAALLVAGGTGLLETSWASIGSVAGMAGLVSILTSIGSDALTGNGPSLTDAEVVTSDVVAQRTTNGDVIAGPASHIATGAPVAVHRISPPD